MLAKSIILRVETCEGGPSQGCKENDEILKFTQDLIVQLWIIDTTMDWRHSYPKSI